MIFCKWNTWNFGLFTLVGLIDLKKTFYAIHTYSQIDSWCDDSCNMAFIEPLHCNKSNITYLLEVMKDLLGHLYDPKLLFWVTNISTFEENMPIQAVSTALVEGWVPFGTGTEIVYVYVDVLHISFCPLYFTKVYLGLHTFLWSISR